MQMHEMAVTHGTANVHVKGHAKRRQREWRKSGRQPVQTGEANVSGWQELAGVFEKMGAPVVHGGARLVA